MAFFEAGLGGTYGGSYRVRCNADVVAQDEDGNQSLVRYSGYVDRVSTSGGYIYNNYATYGHTNLGRYGNPTRGPFTYGMSGTGRMITMASNEDRWYGHDANGNGSDYFGADYDAGNSPYLTSGACGGGVGFPSLYRYADPTGFYVQSATDISITLRVTTNRTCDQIAVSLTGGGNWYYFGGSFTDITVTIGSQSNPLQSGTTFPIRISLRRQASGYWKEAGNWDVATAVSNKFFDLAEM